VAALRKLHDQHQRNLSLVRRVTPRMDINARWTDTSVKMPSGAWQCVLSQGSSLKE
jgi:hypothetical protein